MASDEIGLQLELDDALIGAMPQWSGTALGYQERAVIRCRAEHRPVHLVLRGRTWPRDTPTMTGELPMPQAEAPRAHETLIDRRTIAPGRPVTLMVMPEAGRIDSLRVTCHPALPPETRLRAHWDGEDQPSVDWPLPARSHSFGTVGVTSSASSCTLRLLMPFGPSTRLTLEHRGEEAVAFELRLEGTFQTASRPIRLLVQEGLRTEGTVGRPTRIVGQLASPVPAIDDRHPFGSSWFDLTRPRTDDAPSILHTPATIFGYRLLEPPPRAEPFEPHWLALGPLPREEQAFWEEHARGIASGSLAPLLSLPTTEGVLAWTRKEALAGPSGLYLLQARLGVPRSGTWRLQHEGIARRLYTTDEPRDLWGPTDSLPMPFGSQVVLVLVEAVGAHQPLPTFEDPRRELRDDRLGWRHP